MFLLFFQTGWANVRELEEITGSSDRVSYQNTVKGLIDRNVAKDVYNSICGEWKLLQYLQLLILRIKNHI